MAPQVSTCPGSNGVQEQGAHRQNLLGPQTKCFRCFGADMVSPGRLKIQEIKTTLGGHLGYRRIHSTREEPRSNIFQRLVFGSLLSRNYPRYYRGSDQHVQHVPYSDLRPYLARIAHARADQMVAASVEGSQRQQAHQQKALCTFTRCIWVVYLHVKTPHAYPPLGSWG